MENIAQLPTSYRFYAGGINSVRGYAYKELGPKDAGGRVEGGKFLSVFSAEYEHPILDNWGIAAFIDTGNAYNLGNIDLKTGVGLGVRWYSPVGPVRLDFGLPLNESDSSFQIHFSAGPPNMKKRLSVWLLVGLLATIATLLGLLATEVGSRWLVTTALKALPGEAKLEKIQGGLLGRFKLDGLSYRSDEMDARIAKLDFNWQPSRLFSKTLKITQLVADGVIVTLKPVDKTKKDRAPFPDSLPLPIKPEIDNLLLTNLRIEQNDQVYAFREIQLAVDTENENIRFKKLCVSILT